MKIILILAIFLSGSILAQEKYAVLATIQRTEQLDVYFKDLIKPNLIVLDAGFATELELNVEKEILGEFSKIGKKSIYHSAGTRYLKQNEDGLFYMFVVKHNDMYLLSHFRETFSVNGRIYICGSWLNPYTQDYGSESPGYTSVGICDQAISADELTNYFSEFQFDGKKYIGPTLLSHIDS